VEVRASAQGLIERDVALERLGKALDAGRRGEGALVCIEGPAGIGKTRILEAAGELARARDMEVLSARAAEFERDHPYGVVRQLLGRPVAGASERSTGVLCSGAQRP
jgi:predicted ATPase